MYFNRPKDSRPPIKKSDLIVRMAASSLKNPAAIAGVGILLVAFGLFALWSHEPIFSTLTFAGAIGLGLALDDLKKKKHNRNKMKPKHIAALIAVAGIFLVSGLVTVAQSAPAPTIMILAGAAITGMGLMQLITRRRSPNANGGEN